MIIDGLEINDWSRTVIQEVRSGGVDVVHATVGVWEDLAGAMTRIGAFRHLCRHNADIVRIVTSAEQMRDAAADGVLGVLLGFQNSTMLGDDPEMAQIFADVGIRVVQLTYNIANHLGASCFEPVDGGLTRTGHRMVAALNDASVLIDLSHVGNRTSLEAVHASAQPTAITHGNPLWFCDSPRNKPDEVLESVAARGGVVGCTLYPLFMGGAGVSRARYCAMVARLAEQIGPEHVAIGTDAVLGWREDSLGWMRSGRWDRPVDPSAVPAFPPWPEWFRGPRDFGSLAEGLDEAGFSGTERDAILGGNWLRLFETVFG
ncbi:MAG: membrane dipeptidase [Acidimicrobiaceae bacterium]|nr:membrane dipeptidase [Acidimicrobiaceae bacterium]MYH00876.1 membrane dipeptidase [Acidimicrobiaceae bacterium]MYL03696.1 membrane dipeptidase [Acidimicrobiaceae bacterium]